MKAIIPKLLKKGSHIRVIAPARSLALLSQETIEIAQQRLEKIGFEISFGKNVNQKDEHFSSSVESRVEDIHQAFADKSVDGILTVIGGFNSNQLLSKLDWKLIRSNPKVFCGYSDITILNNVFYAKSGLVNFSGPHFSSFGQKKYFDYTQAYFERLIINGEKVLIQPSKDWYDDEWWLDQDDRKPMSNQGWLVINEGQVEGTIIGGNLGTLQLLQGTDYMPSFQNSILFLEDDSLTFPAELDRKLQSLVHLPNFSQVKGIIFGRFQLKSKIDNDTVAKIVVNKPELSNLPIICGLDFGHTDPKITIPIGGKARLDLTKKDAKLQLSLI